MRTLVQLLRVHVAAFVSVGALATCVDYVAGAEEPSLLQVLALAGLAVPATVAVGLSWALVLAALRGARRSVMWTTWVAIGLSSCGWLAWDLGVWVRLGSTQHGIAAQALLLCAVGGAAVSALGLALQPTASHPLGVVGARTWTRGLGVFAMLAGAVGASILDRTVEPGGYPGAHTALRWFAIGSTAMALVALLSASASLERARAIRAVHRRAAAGLLVALAALPLLLPRSHSAPLVHAALATPYPAMMLRIVRGATDLDGDGYSAVLGGGDCAPFDAKIHPGALEIVANGVDDNCRLGDLAETPGAAVDPPVPERPPPTSVVLITIEALQAQLLSAYGYPRATTPNLATWARGALRFDRAYTSGGWTTLALGSIFHGRYARRLQWNWLVETNQYRLLRRPIGGQLRQGESAKKAFMLPLEEPSRPLQHWLRRRGMPTMAVVDDGYTDVLARYVGAFSGFDSYLEITTSPDKGNHDAKLTRRAMKVLRGASARAQPFFMWVHYFGTHVPDSKHRGVPRFGGGRLGRYLHELAYLDHQLGALLGAIDRARNRGPIAVIITSDHGEVIDGRYRGHGRDLSEAGIRIPLFIQAAGLGTGATQQLASGVDLMPTILGLTDTPQPGGLDGIDLAAPGALGRSRIVLSDTWRIDRGGGFITDQVAAFDGERKLVVNRLDMDESWHAQAAPRAGHGAEPGHLRDAIDRYLESDGVLRIRD